jgi:O-antigen ligase
MTAPVFVAVINSRFPRFLKMLGATAVALAFVGVVLSISRAGLVTVLLVLLAATVATVSYQLTARKIFIGLVVVLSAGGVIGKAWHTLGSRFEETDFKREYKDKKAQGRGYYIRIAEAMVADHWFGVGPNNWSYWASDKYGPEEGFKFVPYNGTDYDPGWTVAIGSNVDNAQAAPAHSLAALTAGEMGLGGLFLFTLLWLRWFQMGASFLKKRSDDPMQRMGVGIFFGTCGIFFQSLTEWVYHQTPIFFTFNILLGTLASLYFVKKHPLAQPRPERVEESAAETPQPTTLSEEIVW